MNRKVTNRVGMPVRGRDFFGREKFVELFWEKILHGNILLAAPRRSGKTSLLYCLMDNPLIKTKIVHIDLQSGTEATDLIVDLLRELAKDEGYNDSVGKIGFVQKSWEFFQKNFEELDIHFAKVKMRNEIRNDWQIKGEKIFQKIAELDSTIIFIFDEFPMMLDAMLKNNRKDEAKTLLRWFRRLRISPELQERIRFVIASSIGIDRILNQLDEISSINDFEKLKLEPFSPKIAKEFLDELSIAYSLPLNDEVKAKMLESIGTPVPYFIQIFFSEVYSKYFHDEEEITVETVEKIYRDKVLVECKLRRIRRVRSSNDW